MPVFAYHITWTTYGTWLPGDARGWIKKHTSGIQNPDAVIAQKARATLAEKIVTLNSSQRAIVEQTVKAHCELRDWPLHAINVRSNHVHLVVTADRTADEVMNQLKAWCSRKLSDAAHLKNTVAKKAGRKHWFTEDGDKEIIEDEQYLANAIHYVLECQ